LVHINRLLENPDLSADYQIFCVPGGFSYGDDIAAGRILASQIRRRLKDALQRFQSEGKLILGICNGFQVLTQTGVLMSQGDDDAPFATLTWNDSGKFEDRWVNLAVTAGRSIFLQGVESLYLPVAHAEGKFVPRNQKTLDNLASGGCLVLKYCQPDSPATNGQVPYPHNPNGSVANVAGVSDATGQVFGLMPHPERFIDRTHHPRWTRHEVSEPGEGMQIFQNAVRYFSS
jgi:phosphoribosylformylglycinamidine synthase